jgi:hypothetical protein
LALDPRSLAADFVDRPDKARPVVGEGLVFVGTSRERCESRRQIVRLEDADKQPMRGRRSFAVVGNLPRHDIRAEGVPVQERVRCLAWVKPMDTLEVAQTYFRIPPAFPLRKHADQHVVVCWHGILLVRVKSRG